MMNFIFELDEKLKNSLEKERHEVEILLKNFSIEEKFKSSMTLRDNLIHDNIESIFLQTRKIIFKESEGYS